MKIKTKKIIAREFLILLGTSLLYFILIFGWLGLIELNQNKEKRVENEIESISKKIKQNLIYLSQIEYDEKLANNLSILIDKGLSEQDLELFRQNFKLKYRIKYRPDLKLIDEYGIPIKKNAILPTKEKDISTENNTNEINFEKLMKYQNDLIKIKSSYFNDNIYDRKLLLMIILISIFFPLRYLIYATKWSFKQIKE